MNFFDCVFRVGTPCTSSEFGWATAGYLAGIVPVTRGGGLLDDIAKTTTEVIHKHHPWPKYLGGSAKQNLAERSKTVHDAFHRGLDRILPRRRGTAYYDGLSDTARQQMQRDLGDYTKAFDAQHGTSLYELLVRNGFPGT